MNSAPLAAVRFATVIEVEDGEREQKLAGALEEYAAALMQGKPACKEELLAKYADIADELSGCLDSLDFIHQVAPQFHGDLALPGSGTTADIRPLATLGDFRIIRELGRGGMGVVYEAEQLSLGRRVALKVLPFAAMLGDMQLKRFHNEARAAATLEHPNIVAVYSVGVERGVHYYAMQLVDGYNLAQVIAEVHAPQVTSVSNNRPGGHSPCENNRVATLSTLRTKRPQEFFRVVAQLAIQAADALDHAHQQGILHRDIKPANLLVDAAGKLRVTDFGLARIEADATMTVTGDTLGTLRFMSPEQLSASRAVVDHRTDIYSLGITLYELITGAAAFDSIDRAVLLKAIVEIDPKPIRKNAPAIPADLETIVTKAIDKDPTTRYATAKDLSNDLRRFLDHRTIVAKKPGLVNKARKLVRRHQATSLAIATAIVAVSLLSAAYTADRWRQVRETNRFVETSLNAARTSLETGDVQQAVVRLSEAKSRIAAVKSADPAMAAEVSNLLEESNRYLLFVPLMEEARWKSAKARENLAPEQQALALYHVLDRPDWFDSLRTICIPEQHLARVSNAVYELLIFMADECTRWEDRWPVESWRESRAIATDQARRYLDAAISFHAPSRGYYWELANIEYLFHHPPEEKHFRDLAWKTPVDHTAELFYINRDRRWGTVSETKGYPKYTFEENYKDHRKMLRRDPGYYNALFFMGVIFNAEHRNREALVAWYGCLALRPNDATVLATRSVTHQRLGQYDEAIADAEAAMAIAPQNYVGYSAAAWIFATCADARFRDGPRALELAERARSIAASKQNGDSADLLDSLAAAYAETGDFDTAASFAQKAHRLETNDQQQIEIHRHLEYYRQDRPWRTPVEDQ
ncbi:MAG: protein kinase [Pirellulales bacterium]